MLLSLSTSCSTAVEEVCCTDMFVILLRIAAVVHLIMPELERKLPADDSMM